MEYCEPIFRSGENVNSALYYEVLLKLQDAIHRKRPSQLARGVLSHHDNARPHTAQATQERLQELQWELLKHPPYSPDLATNDFQLFGLLKNNLVANVTLMMKLKWLRQQSKDFYATGFDILVKRWDKCIDVGGGYVEK
jgi:histone-lysine N-methyltransferase SETMAR